MKEAVEMFIPILAVGLFILAIKMYFQVQKEDRPIIEEFEKHFVDEDGELKTFI